MRSVAFKRGVAEVCAGRSPAKTVIEKRRFEK